MELPKNITQIGETNPHCKVYVEDYVISYIKRLNSYAGDKALAVALYGIRKEEAGVTYCFFYGACKLDFLQKECRHLSQAVLQEAEKRRVKYFPEYAFLGYKLLDGEMIESFHICEQNVCRSIEGYAQFYEKNDRMLAFMLEERQTEAAPEKFNQEKYDVVKKRQEERRALADGKEGHALFAKIKLPKKAFALPAPGNGSLRSMRMTAAAVVVLLGIVGLAVMGGGEKLGDLQTAARQLMEEMTEKQLPDMVEVANGSAQAGTIVAEDKLTDAILRENAAAGNGASGAFPGGRQDSDAESPAPGTEQTAGEPTQPGIGQIVTGTDQPGTSQAAGEANSSEAGEAAGEASQPGAGEAAGEASQPGTGEAAGETSQPSAPEQPEPPVSGTSEQPAPEPVSYTIQRGDTLIGICLKRYGSDEKVTEICSLNNISNPDDIKEGAKILLP